MTAPQRSSNQKLVDSLFSGAPFPLVTSDQGLALKYLREISTALDGHQSRTERSLAVSNPPSVHRADPPAYLDSADVALNTSRIANSQEAAAETLEDIYDSQRTLVKVTRGHTGLFQRMVRCQDTSNALLWNANRLSELQSGGAMDRQ